jgi:ABC-type amino acid transport system permease subunit
MAGCSATYIVGHIVGLFNCESVPSELGKILAIFYCIPFLLAAFFWYMAKLRLEEMLRKKE